MSGLFDELIARIRARGAITFAEYMDAALYDPLHGYYSTRARIGFEGDYLTASDLGPWSDTAHPSRGLLFVTQVWGELS